MPAITVIVPTRRRHHLLPRAVRSILGQTFSDLELLVVDDNPPGERISANAALSDLLREPRIRVLEHDQPKNAASARNFALAEARGEWVTYLDDDDAYQPTKLEKQHREALRTGLPLGMCGMTYHLAPRTRRRHLHATAFAGPELLFSFQALPVLFHRNTSGKVRFQDTLPAGEDAYYFFSLLRHFAADRVFNVPEPLVDIFPQPGPRVNTNAEGLLLASQAILRDFAPAFGARASRAYAARGHLEQCKFKPGGWFDTAKTAAVLLRLRGRQEARFVANVLLHKVPWMRKYIVR